MSEPTVKRTRSASKANKGPRAPTFTDRLEIAALGAVGGFLSLLGPDRSSALMGRAWRLFGPMNRRHSRADAHLATAMPNLSDAERRVILGDMWENLGRTAAETFLLPRLVEDPTRFELNFKEEAQDFAKQGIGALFASLHMGNWELTAWGIRLAGLRTAAVYQPLKNPLADAFLHARRASIFDAGLFPRDASTAFRLRTLARQGVAIGMLADLRDATGVEVSFFGRPAVANTLPAMLARRLDLPLIAGRSVRTNGARFRIEAVRIDVPMTDNVEADILSSTVALTRQYEAWIRETPSQWMWAHRKWKDAPSGDR